LSNRNDEWMNNQMGQQDMNQNGDTVRYQRADMAPGAPAAQPRHRRSDRYRQQEAPQAQSVSYVNEDHAPYMPPARNQNQWIERTPEDGAEMDYREPVLQKRGPVTPPQPPRRRVRPVIWVALAVLIVLVLVAAVLFAPFSPLKKNQANPASVNTAQTAQVLEFKAPVSSGLTNSQLQLHLTTSPSVTGVKLMDAQGNEIPTSSVRMETSEVELTVPVYKEGVMPLEIGFLNIPDGFDASILPYTLSRNSIRVASSEANIAALQSRVVGYIDLANFDADGRYSFDIELPSGWANLDSVKSVDVVFDVSGLASKVITVSDIRVENVPAGTDISVLTDSIRNVTVFGDAAVVQRLLPTSVVAVVDADEIVLQQGSYNVPVHFRIPGVYNVWVTGSYTVTIEAESGQ